MTDQLVTFHVEPLLTFMEESCGIFKRHWEEVALHQDTIKLNIDWKQYAQQEAGGAFCGIVARHEGQVVGYWVGFIRPHFHYADSLTAYTDLYFVDKPYRKSGVGFKLFEFVEKTLKQRGVQKIFTATKLHLDHSALFKAAGYTETEIVFTKLLEQ